MTSSKKKYGQKWKNEKFVDLDLPSGNTAQVRRPGIQGLIKAGVLESMDVLTGLVQQVTLPKAEGKPEVSAEKMVENPDSIKRMLDILDDIALYVVNRPRVRDKYKLDDEGVRILDESKKPILLLDSEREYDDETDEEADPIIYVDEVDLEDKMFLMDYVVGGSRDFARFRDSAQEIMGSVHDSEADEPTPE